MAGYIYRSEATEEAVGRDFIDYLGKLSDEGKIERPRAILGINDITNEDPFGWIADQARLSRAFELAGIEGENDITRFARKRLERVQEAGPAAYPVQPHDHSGGIILYYDATDTKIFSDFLNIPEEDLELNLDTTSLERFMMLHEAVHLEHGHLGKDQLVKKEYLADQEANELYYQAYQDGIVTDPEVPYAFRAMRAIDTVFDISDGGYTLNGVTTLPRETPLVTESNRAEAIQSVRDAKDALEFEVGKVLVSVDDFIRLDALQNLQWEEIEGVEPFELSEEILDRINEAEINEDAEAVAQILREVEIPEAYRAAYEEEIQEELESKQRAVGAVNLRDNPNLAYVTARTMLERGDFAEDPVGQALMQNFVDGVERYAPEHFGVTPDDRPEGRPEIVEQLAAQFAPTAEAAAPAAVIPDVTAGDPLSTFPMGTGQR